MRCHRGALAPVLIHPTGRRLAHAAEGQVDWRPAQSVVRHPWSGRGSGKRQPVAVPTAAARDRHASRAAVHLSPAGPKRSMPLVN